MEVCRVCEYLCPDYEHKVSVGNFRSKPCHRILGNQQPLCLSLVDFLLMPRYQRGLLKLYVRFSK